MEDDLKNMKPCSEQTQKLHAELMELLNVSRNFSVVNLMVFGF